METSGARIGPNAILQLLPVLDDRLGEQGRTELLRAALIETIPSGEEMIDERDVARLHRELRAACPQDAAAIASAAGRRTGDYILAHRIPRLAQTLLRLLPASIAAGLLAKAISRHAWTFIGSGEFHVCPDKPLAFEIRNNPLIRGETSPRPMCHWHAAVFARLFNALVRGHWRVEETRCAASGAPVCRFELIKTTAPLD